MRRAAKSATGGRKLGGLPSVAVHGRLDRRPNERLGPCFVDRRSEPPMSAQGARPPTGARLPHGVSFFPMTPEPSTTVACTDR